MGTFHANDRGTTMNQIIVNIEEGVVQSIEGIPATYFVEIRYHDKDHNRYHPQTFFR